ncbi:acetylpolyamine amidohydrolase [Ensifer sp. NM-2]|uniref:histone deacetylase family protein n=1 Tax=Ensifer sp. NM-2 TaxID=2109730 RepID=UPI000D122FA0|nr:histone deacetylase family protein [Ensifer sp. NM-2]PSS60114.1 acetylpolyamine amidohydrolase [Ensifer sp. NM-2]
MLAICDDRQAAHRPLTRLAGGGLAPNPEQPQRIELLKQGLSDCGIRLVSPTADSRDAIAAVHDADYLDFLENGFAEWKKSPANGPEMRASAHPTIRMNRKPIDILGRAGYFQADASCVLLDGTWEAVCASADTAVEGMTRVLNGENKAYSLCRPPGHHAYADKAGGFCYLNNTAIAAELAANQGLRIAIIDVDVHHGNGTQSIFYDRSDVMTLSVHGDPAHLYPYYSGYADEEGEGKGFGFNRNFPVPLLSDSEIYLAAVDRACETARKFSPDVLIVALGLDASSADPFACMNVDEDGFRRMGERLGKLCRKSLVVQEGGYPSPSLPGLLKSFLGGFTVS